MTARDSPAAQRYTSAGWWIVAIGVVRDCERSVTRRPLERRHSGNSCLRRHSHFRDVGSAGTENVPSHAALRQSSNGLGSYTDHYQTMNSLSVEILPTGTDL